MRSPRSERKRQRILESAGHCFAQRGFAKTTVEEIAAGAGVSKGLVYTYFRGKEALLDAVLEETLREWRAAVDASVREPGLGARDRILRRQRASIDFARSHPVLRAIFARDPGVMLLGLETRFESEMKEWRCELQELLREGIRSGELRADLDVDRAADVLRVLYGSIIARLFEESSINVAEEGFLSAVSDLVLRGIAAGETR
ncbi:MAG: TetR/AcrR family transcriptional regulator [Myxococcota bacterium]